MLAVINGRILTMAGKEYEKGTVLIDGKKIVEVGEKVDIPSDTEIIDATGKVVMPGLIDAHTHVGILEEVYRIEGDDVNEGSDPITPHLRAIDGINPEDLGFQDALEGGVTTVVTGPGSGNVIGGENLAMKTYGRVVDEMVIKNPIGLKVAFGENPKRVHGDQNRAPVTRMATAALFREALVKAQNYMAKMDNGTNNKAGDSAKENLVTERDLKMEVLAKVLRREIPIRAHAHRADDIMTAIRIAEEFNLKIIVEHCTEGFKIADQLSKRGIPAVVGPLLINRAKVELKDRTLANPKLLAESGVKVAFMTDHPVIPINYLSLSAALAVREGMDENLAMKALTCNAAELLGLDDKVGTLEKGKDADIIILNGPLFELKTCVETVLIDGMVVFCRKRD